MVLMQAWNCCMMKTKSGVILHDELDEVGRLRARCRWPLSLEMHVDRHIRRRYQRRLCPKRGDIHIDNCSRDRDSENQRKIRTLSLDRSLKMNPAILHLSQAPKIHLPLEALFAHCSIVQRGLAMTLTSDLNRAPFVRNTSC